MDYNRDSYLDLLIGDCDGETWIFNGSKDGLQTGKHLFANGVKISAGAVSSPCLVDWNEDGYWDLFFGGYRSAAFLHLYMNTKKDKNALNYTSYKEFSFFLKYGETHQFYDLDSDGDKDLIFGRRNGKVSYCENKRTNSDPLFSDNIPISSVDGVIDVENCSREFVCDWNNDGVADLLVGGIGGENSGRIRLYLGSNMVKVKKTNTSVPKSINIRSNPHTKSIFVDAFVQSNGTLLLSIYDCTGRVLNQTKYLHQIGKNTMSCDMSNYPAGFYYIVVNTNDSQLSNRIVWTK